MERHIVKISQLISFLLVMILISYVALSSGVEKINVNISLLIIYGLILGVITDIFFGESIQNDSMTKRQIVLIGGMLATLGIIWLFGFRNIEGLIAIGFLISVFARIDARIFFVFSLLVFCYIALYLVLGQKIPAETLSIYAYYLMIAGVLSQISQKIFSFKSA